LVGFLKEKKKRSLKELELLYVNTVNTLVKDVTQCFVTLVIAILETLVQNVEKQIFKMWKIKKPLNQFFTTI
jgi:hypothetical protein